MDFLSGLTIDVSKIPTYPAIDDKPFHETINIPLARVILASTDPRLTKEHKQPLEALLKATNQGKGVLSVKYEGRFGTKDKLGRRYADKSISVGLLHHLIKNTLFALQDIIDLDQRKAHPTFLLEIASRTGISLPAIAKYVKNPGRVLAATAEHYSLPGEDPVTVEDVKWLFNMMLYGGSPDTWVKDMLSGVRRTVNPNDRESRNAKPKRLNANHHQFVPQFSQEARSLSKKIYEANPHLLERIDPPVDTTRFKKTSKVMALFCGIIENDLTYTAYSFMVKNGHCKARTTLMMYDGFALPRPAGDLPLILKEMNEHVHSHCGLKTVEFVVKPPDQSKVMWKEIEELENMTPVDDGGSIGGDGNDDDDDNPLADKNEDRPPQVTTDLGAAHVVHRLSNGDIE
jgi:hypothetical protein